MMKKRPINFILSILLIGIAGCTHHIQIQKSFVVEDQLLPRLNMMTPVSIIATPLSSAETIEFCKPVMGTVTANYADLADYALQSALDIFKRNKVRVTKRYKSL